MKPKSRVSTRGACYDDKPDILIEMHVHAYLGIVDELRR